MTRRTRPDFEREEQLSRAVAAERLVDIAFALSSGPMLELRARDGHVDVPVADCVRLERRSTRAGDGVAVEIRLTWSAPYRSRNPHDDESPGDGRPSWNQTTHDLSQEEP